LQRTNEQMPPVHELLPFGTAHRLPQAPQLSGSLGVCDSQPLLRIPSQSSKPVAQLPMPQRPKKQAFVPLGALPQLVPQLPQFDGSESTAVSQPLLPGVKLEASASQSAKPGWQRLKAQAPALQVVRALASPQLVPQVPQLFGSRSVGVSQPLKGLLSQSAQPASHAGATSSMAQRPKEQATAVVCRRAPSQTVPQRPQFIGSLWGSTSQPSLGSALQSAKPKSHAPIAQVPEVQEALAFA